MRRRKIFKKWFWTLLSTFILCLSLVGCQDSETVSEDVKTNDYAEETIYESTVESVPEIAETTEQEIEEEIVSKAEETTSEIAETQVVEETVVAEIPEPSVEEMEEQQPEPTPQLEPEPVPEPQPEPAPQVEPEPQPEAALQAEPVPAPEPQPEQPTGGSGSYAVNGKNGKIHIVGACPATGNGKNAMKEPHYFNTYEEADAYSSGIEGNPDKRKCGNCW